MAKRNVKIKSIKRGSALLFTSAGGIRSGQVVSLPAAEATKLIGKGYAIKVVVRRKKKDVTKNADSNDDGRMRDPGREQFDAFGTDAPTTGDDGPGVEHTDQAPRSDSGDDSGVR